MTSTGVYDVIIIGGGPAGLTAAQYSARANLTTLLLEAPRNSSALAFASTIENYPGLMLPTSGQELLTTFRTQAERFGAQCREEAVLGVQLDGEVKEVQGEARLWQGRAIIIASGSMARAANIPGEASYLGRGVSYCATCDAPFFRGLTICVAGDSADTLKEAEYLAGFAQTVHLLWGAKGLDCPSLPANVHLHPATRLVAIEGDDVVRAVRLKDLASGHEEELAADGVFLYLHGTEPAVGFLEDKLFRGERACILTHDAVETSIPGVFAAGDVICAAVRQVVVSAAQGCLAALAAEKYLQQRKRLRLDWGPVRSSFP